MQPSRRRMLGIVGAVAAASTSGCTASELLPTSAPDNQPSEEDAGTTFEVRLSGPETDQLLFDETDIATVGAIQQRESGSYTLLMTLKEYATSSVSEMFRTVGVRDNTDAFEVVLMTNRSEEVNRFGVAPGLAQSIAEEEWEGEFVLRLGDRERAERIRNSLTAE